MIQNIIQKYYHYNKFELDTVILYINNADIQSNFIPNDIISSPNDGTVSQIIIRHSQFLMNTINDSSISNDMVLLVYLLLILII